ncbi:hypothetical protein A71_54 [Escherichia phage A7_1]|uniref:Uncharacterized protein n=2 Tax=Vequintavirinae TaxID=1911928 RepID=A0AAE9VXJ7_9CAUD|nr:hypothetical protein [Escherichia phage UPEC06]UZZ64132.1 hypothetical protein A71_54 [Escherichia phage A7_1]UZZ64411.1 hypothetical protein A54_171 [Escherichia phage A5-4]WBF77753.1 hypothetical protein A73_201 [Escherichia phage A73]WBF78005.1 hypothetical protein W70_186 [Escherichia phage W70]
MRCGKGRWVVREGDYVEILSKENGSLLASFKVKSDMCKEMFDMYLHVMYDVRVDYKIRKIK